MELHEYICACVRVCVHVRLCVSYLFLYDM